MDKTLAYIKFGFMLLLAVFLFFIGNSPFTTGIAILIASFSMFFLLSVYLAPQSEFAVTGYAGRTYDATAFEQETKMFQKEKV